MKELLALILAAMMVFGTFSAASADEETALPKIDMTKWQYEASDDVYWQVGLSYAASPADSSYETMGIFVPGVYFTASDNGDGTYTCTVNEAGAIGQYTAVTAPLILPVNTPGYSAMAAPTGYSSSMGYGSISDYTNAGMIVIFAGARGRDDGAPAGVTDFKAAIRYTRYNADLLPGDMNSIFSLGMSGGGAQSALIGATGNSALYDPYLEAIGAVMTESDAVKGSMCWCPITNLDVADEAYEWNMGSTRSGLSEENQAYSDGMALAFAEYINQLGLTDEEGNALTLAESEEGIYQSGSYYDYVKSVIETSLSAAAWAAISVAKSPTATSVDLADRQAVRYRILKTANCPRGISADSAARTRSRPQALITKQWTALPARRVHLPLCLSAAPMKPNRITSTP